MKSIYDEPLKIDHHQRLKDQLFAGHKPETIKQDPVLTLAQKRILKTLKPTERLVFLRNIENAKENN